MYFSIIFAAVFINAVSFVHSRPQYLSGCSVITGSAPGAPQSDCAISIAGGITEYAPSTSYQVTVTAASNLAVAIAVSAGTLSAGGTNAIKSQAACRYQFPAQASTTFTFVSPVSGTAVISALCGSNNAGIVRSADKLTLNPAPTLSPTVKPTLSPTISPTKKPTTAPTYSPSNSPTPPTQSPTNKPTTTPTISPSKSPLHPTKSPTKKPSVAPTNSPTDSPTKTRRPSAVPTTITPTISPTTKAPTITKTPTKAPVSPTPSSSEKTNKYFFVMNLAIATIMTIFFAI